MKKLLLFFSAYFIVMLQAFSVFAQEETPAQTFYIDFGYADSELDDDGNPKGQETTMDANGNYWTNVTNQNYDAPLVDIINSDNEATGYQVDMISSFGKLGKAYGGLETPEAEKLDDIAVGSATEDYFYLGHPYEEALIQFKGLDPNKKYKFSIFGSRGGGVPDWTSGYKVEGVNVSIGTLQTSVGFKGNTENIFISDGIFPNALGDIMFTLTRETQTDDPEAYNAAYVNLIKIEEFETSDEYVAVTGLELTIDPIDSPLANKKANVTLLPENATVRTIDWSSSDESIAIVDANGMIHPKMNGTVEITATSTDNAGAISQTVEVVISGQTNELYLGGTALDKEQAQKFLYRDELTGALSNLFYAYVPLLEEQDFYFYHMDEEGNEVAYGVDNEGNLVKDGFQITVPTTGPYRVMVDFNAGVYELLPITNWKIVGTQTPGSWPGDGLEIAYEGGSIWSSTITLAREEGESYNGIIFKMNDLGDALYGTMTADFSQLSYLSQADRFGGVRNIDIQDGEYKITLNFEDYSYKFESVGEDDPFGITFSGSSVAQGWGSVDGHTGYAKLYHDLLIERSNSQLGEAWNYNNVSIGGDNTIKMLNRYNLHVTSSGTKYVVYGLSLANEGIMSGGQPIFDQFRDNLLQLIEQTRADGKVPVIMNNYANGLYNEEHYAFIKEMNLLIHQWDVPSFNALGALDNGMGQFVDSEVPEENYESDTAHPNDLGHAEFFHSMVPSLFDALHAEKPLPTRMSETSLSLSDNQNVNDISFTPDGEVHSFTSVLSFKTTAEGTLVSFSNAEVETNGTLALTAEGKLEYTSPSGATILCEKVVNDNMWHTLTLTYYYAWGKTLLYVDAEMGGNVDEQLLPSMFTVHNIESAESLEVKEWFFYRAGMNAEEIAALQEGAMLKSSLEVYAPFSNDVKEGTFLNNYAQSTVQLSSTIDKVDQVIDFGQIEDKTYGDEAFTLSATVDSELDLVFTSSDENVISIDGNTATIIGSGEVTITVSQEGTAYYNSATASSTFSIAKADQTILFDLVETINVTEGSITLSASASSEMEISFSSSDESVVSIEGNIATLIKAGEVTITATQVGNNNYNEATTQNTLTVEEEQVTSLRNDLEKINVYPNPTSNFFKLQWNVEAVTINSVNGNLVKTFTGNSAQYDVSDLAKGTYFLLIETGSGTKYSKLLIE